MPAADISWNSHKITSLATCTAAGDAANKGYVDGKVAIVKGTHYWSIPGMAFTTQSPDTEDIYKDPDEGGILADANGIFFICEVELPHGAVVTGVIIYGNAAATAETWYLRRLDPANYGFASTMATANIGTEDTTITNATIDNSAYSYFIETSSLDAGDTIYGARITYTL